MYRLPGCSKVFHADAVTRRSPPGNVPVGVRRERGRSKWEVGICRPLMHGRQPYFVANPIISAVQSYSYPSAEIGTFARSYMEGKTLVGNKYGGKDFGG